MHCLWPEEKDTKKNCEPKYSEINSPKSDSDIFSDAPSRQFYGLLNFGVRESNWGTRKLNQAEPRLTQIVQI